MWDRIAPGLASQFDSPYSIPTIAPRPLLILGGAEDRRCPVAGLEIPRSMASQAYGEFQCLDNLKVYELVLFGYFGEKIIHANVVRYQFIKNGFNSWLQLAIFRFKRSTIL